jgi:NhaP-type Na+/H+ or K+/H+ antiporter
LRDEAGESADPDPVRSFLLGKIALPFVVIFLTCVFLLGLIGISKITKTFFGDGLSLPVLIVGHAILGLLLLLLGWLSPKRRFLSCRPITLYLVVGGVYFAGVAVGIYVYFVP